MVDMNRCVRGFCSQLLCTSDLPKIFSNTSSDLNDCSKLVLTGVLLIILFETKPVTKTTKTHKWVTRGSVRGTNKHFLNFPVRHRNPRLGD
jgi:hypothetical protein